MQIKKGDSVVFDGLIWGFVEEVDNENKTAFVVDQDGGDHEIDFNRIDHVDPA